MRSVSTRRHRVALLAALGLAFTLTGAQPAAAAEAAVGLGTASSYGVLGGTTVTNTGPTVVGGDLGVSPGSAVTGFPPGIVNNGTIHMADAGAAQAQLDTTTAYNDAAGRSTTSNIAADLGGQTLVSGVYAGGAIGLTGNLTLDAQGDPSAAFIFKASSTLITASASSISLIGGASACNVFWQVGSSATLGSGSQFAGTILALTAISVNTGTTVNGRLLARNAAVTLDSDTVTVSSCVAQVPPTTTTTTSTTSTTLATTTTTSTTSTTLASTTTTVGGGAVATTTSVPGGGTSVDLPRTGGHVTATALAGIASVLMGIGLLSLVNRRTIRA